jgi:hypothetical protein
MYQFISSAIGVVGPNPFKYGVFITTSDGLTKLYTKNGEKEFQAFLKASEDLLSRVDPDAIVDPVTESSPYIRKVD